MSNLREDEGGPSGVTQAANVNGGKVDMFGTKSKSKDVDGFYEMLLELDDYKAVTRQNRKYIKNKNDETNI